jgi:hypothetical protein
MKLNKMTKQELVKFLVANLKNEQGYVDLTGLDFTKEDIDCVIISEMKVDGDLYQEDQTVKGDLWQDEQEVEGDLTQNRQQVQGRVMQNYQRVRGNLIQNRHKVKGELYN